MHVHKLMSDDGHGKIYGYIPHHIGNAVMRRVVVIEMSVMVVDGTNQFASAACEKSSSLARRRLRNIK